jgi:hypothetical protein
MDTLSDVLRAVRLTGAFFFDVHARAPWCAETPFGHTVVDAMFPGSDHLICYHLMMEGSCWATIEGEEPIKLSAGDIILLPHGDTHVLATAPGMRKTPEMSMYRMPEDRELPTRFRFGAEGGELTHFVCGFLGCDSRPYNPLLTALPRVIVINDHTSGALGATFGRRWRSARTGAWAAQTCSAASVSSCSSTRCVVTSRRCPKIASTGSRDCAINMSAAR